MRWVAKQMFANREANGLRLGGVILPVTALGFSRAALVSTTVKRCKLLAKAILLMGAMGWSLIAGAVTITQSVNRNPELCRQFLAMVKAADVPHMTDAQLCDFSFAKLPASKTAGFTFPTWNVLPVANAQDMYVKMVLANRAAYPKGPRFTRNFDAVLASLRNEIQHHNVTFYTTTLPISMWSTAPYLTTTQRKAMPSSLTLVEMRVPDCSRSRTNFVGGRSYAFFTKPDLTASIPQLSLYDGSEIALWKDRHGKEWPVAVEVPPYWFSGTPALKIPTRIFALVSSMAWQPKSWFSVAGLAGSTACAYHINK